MDMRAALARATAELTRAEADLRSAQERVDRLRTIRAGLELAVEAYEKPMVDAAASADDLRVRVDSEQVTERPVRRDLPGIPPPSSRRKPPSFTDLSIASLTDLGRPALTREISDRSIAAGYSKAKPEQTRNALTWLLSKGRVMRVAPGTWALPEEEPGAEDDFTPAEAAGVSTTGENGHSSQSHVLARADLAPQPAGQVSF